ncbi:MAG TPA: tetratricopeptide repeat protein [Pyrinomonadaceae bacterium]
MRIIFSRCWYVRTLVVACAICTMVSVLRAQTANQFPIPTTHINDFAGVIDIPVKNHLETLLVGLKERTKIDFYVATVDATGGQDIAVFSRQLATDWKIGTRTSATKSLLLVVAVASKTSVTQFSRLVQSVLPEGILGDMGQRMRDQLTDGRFTEAIEQGVLLFLNSIAPKLGFAVEDFEKSGPANASVAEKTPDAAQQPASEPAQTRPRVVGEASKTEASKTREETTNTSPAPTEDKPVVTETPTVATEVKRPEKKTTSTPLPKASAKTNKAASKQSVEPVDDEAEAEEVELTLTLPLAKRAEKLKSFLDTHPDSKARPRAVELLISTHAGLGDQFLKADDVANGVQQLMLAIDEADAGISEKLYSGVIGQIPANLFLRGQSDAAFEAATKIEKKFGTDPKRLIGLAGFYVTIERGDEAIRIAEEAVKLTPDSAEAHRVLAVSHHINLQLDEAAAEYKKTVDLDPTSKASLNTLADLTRANGKFEQALALYDQLLKLDPKDGAATAGRVICLFELGRTDEATTALDAALADEPKNLALLSGTAYWFASHENYQKAFDLAQQAIRIEPRYTWAQIALVRSLLGLNRNIGAERAMRYARQFGKFPTLNYELANVVASMGFFDEAVEILRESFSFKDGQVETLLAGRIPARDKDLMTLLGPERRASLYQPTAADSAANSKMLTTLLAFDTALSQKDGEKIDETGASSAAREFASGEDGMKSYRQLYAASRLVKSGVALTTALELVDASKQGLEVALHAPVATTAAQADEFRGLRAQAIAAGTIPDIAEAPRSALSNIMRGRMEDLTGWILFNQDKYPEAIEHLKQASTVLPNGTPAWRNTLWHLGVVLEQTGRNDEALESYIQSYNAGERDAVRRSVIERLYRKVKGSADGLEDRVGPAISSSKNQATENTSATVTSPGGGVSETTNSSASLAPAEKASTTATTEAPKPEPAIPTASPETTPASTPEPTPAPSSESSPTPTPSPETSSTTTTDAPATPPAPITDDALRAAASRVRSNIKISGRILDSTRTGISNVVVVLISPSGSVLASTTDNDGYYSFNVVPSQKTYRLIPSKDGYSFSPIDKVFAGLINDQTGVDFAGSINRSP